MRKNRSGEERSVGEDEGHLRRRLGREEAERTGGKKSGDESGVEGKE